jgi:hypothetical protein
MVFEVFQARLGNFDLVGDNAVVWTGLGTLDGLVDVLESLLHVAFDIEGETRGFGDGEPEVKGYATGDTSKTDEETPAVVDSFGRVGGLGKDGALVGGDDDEGDEAGSWRDIRSISW